MADEILQIDANNRNVLGAITNDASEFIRNLRVNPVTNALICEATVTSNNTQIGSSIPGATQGSIFFAGPGGTLDQDNNNLFWDDTNNFLGINTNTPAYEIDVVGDINVTGNFLINGSPVGGSGHVIAVDSVTFAQEGELNFVNFFTGTDVPGVSTNIDLNVTNVANSATFVTALIANNTFTTNLATSNNFVTNLAANNTFATSLVANNIFTTTLGGSSNFINTLTANSTFISNLSSSTSITVSSTGFTVSQVAHGLSVGNIIKNSGANTYAKAQANSAANAEVVGYVTVVPDVDHFTFVSEGVVATGVPAQAAGTVMFLDPTTAGALTTTSPTTATQVVKPLLVVLQNATTAYFHNYRGELLNSTGTVTTNSAFSISTVADIAKKVGTGSTSNTTYYNFQMPFVFGMLANGNTDAKWNLTGASNPDSFNSLPLDSTNQSLFGTIDQIYDDYDGTALRFDDNRIVIVEGDAAWANGTDDRTGWGLTVSGVGGTNIPSGAGTNDDGAFFCSDAAGSFFTHTGTGAAHTETAITSLANGHHTLRIEVDKGNGTPQVRFYVDGSLVATHTTNLPVADIVFGGGNAGAITGGMTFISAPSFAIQK